MFLPWILCGVLLITSISLYVKIRILQKSMDEICKDMEEHLSEETNTPIFVSSRDKYVRHLAEGLNKELAVLRMQRQQYENGNSELKEAVVNISHDLRTPLTAICGYLDLLEKEEKSEEVMRYLSFIENRVLALKQLTEELFRYSIIVSSQEALQLEMISLNGVLEEGIAAFYAALKERGITPNIQMTKNQIICQANKDAVSRVFSNILNNALKYSDGDLDIIMDDNGEIIFTNTASCLDEVQVGKLFNRFFTVEDARNSTGLGLAISKTLVEQMNGTISAMYENGKLSVRITFPIKKLEMIE